MKTKWIASLILASALTAPAFAGVGVYIGTAPPPLRYEVRGPMPGPGYAWVLVLGRWKVRVETRSVAEAALCGCLLEPPSL
jgi:hypothetical protein